MADLKQAVEIYEDCGYHRMTCEDECPLKRPVHEHSEHPTFCDLLREIDDNLTIPTEGD